MATILQLAAAKECRHTFQQARLYQSFSSVEEMDLNVKQHIIRCSSYLSRGTLKILRHLSGHSCKFPGVSFGRIAYIAKETGLSERTVQISLKKLEAEGVIRRVPTLGRDGRRSVNLIVIQPCGADLEELGEDLLLDRITHEVSGANFTPREAEETKQDKAEEHLNGGRSSFKLNKTKNNDDSNIRLDPNYISSKLNQYGIAELAEYAVSYRMPERIYLEIAGAIRLQIDFREYESYNVNDLRNSFRRATSRFMELFKQAYPISSYSSFYITLLGKELKRCRDLRAAG